jgi:hypothetical protein
MQCEQLAIEIQQVEKTYLKKFKEQQATFEVCLNQELFTPLLQREMRSQKDAWATAEKIRRDAWINGKTKSIKQQTIKGLEPEIHRLIAQNQVDESLAF